MNLGFHVAKCCAFQDASYLDLNLDLARLPPPPAGDPERAPICPTGNVGSMYTMDHLPAYVHRDEIVDYKPEKGGPFYVAIDVSQLN